MTTIQIAIKALDEAVSNRARIGAQISNSAPPDVIAQYERAFEAEQNARRELSRLLDERHAERMRAGGL